MKRKVETVLIFIFLNLFLIIMLTSPKDVIESVTFSIDIWINNLFPSLFPFLILSKIIINYGISDVLSNITKPFLSNRLNIGSKGNYIIILSLFSGFPSSAVYLKDAYQKDEITKNELEYLLGFCFFSNPLFILGTVGVMLFNNVKIGVYILISHYLSNFILAYITRPRTKENKPTNIRKSFSEMKTKISNSDSLATVIKTSIFDSINILLLLLGIISIFLVISNVLLKGIKEPLSSIISGLLEMTGGIKKVALLNIPSKFKYLLTIFFISMGGLSIHMQILSILDKIKINYKKFLLNRTIASVIAIIILLILLH